ncbi:MAG: AAA family ATPase [Gemmataceae bacterium]|nr:AAA family ATPase [Gemmataceae bacterium]
MDWVEIVVKIVIPIGFAVLVSFLTFIIKLIWDKNRLQADLDQKTKDAHVAEERLHQQRQRAHEELERHKEADARERERIRNDASDGLKERLTAMQERARLAEKRLVDNRNDAVRRVAGAFRQKNEALAQLHQQLARHTASHGSLSTSLDLFRDERDRINALAENRLAELREKDVALQSLRLHIADTESRVQELERTCAELGDERAAREEAITELRSEFASLQSKLQDLLRDEGRLWDRPATGRIPAFRPLAERKVPILSVLNLKGGVGKTTIAANLAGSFADMGRRVLLVDLDYQRSLSQLLLDDDQRKMRHLEEKSLQHFLGGSDHSGGRFVDFPGEIGNALENGWLVPNSDRLGSGDRDDSLEESEMRLMIEWMLRPDRKDIRYLLREALHSPEIADKFDVVILDCPPRLTTACVNGLAASDFVVAPIGLDALSANSLGNLLKSLTVSNKHVFEHLRVLGVIANQATPRNGAPIREQRDVFEDLKRKYLGIGLRFFDTVLFRSNVFGACANDRSLAMRETEVGRWFAELAREVTEAMESHERTHAVAVS